MDYCEGHINMVQAIARIETKLEDIDNKIARSIKPMEEHVAQGEKWRLAVIGIIFAGILQIVSFAYFWGMLYNQVQINTDRWTRVIEKGGFK